MDWKAGTVYPLLIEGFTLNNLAAPIGSVSNTNGKFSQGRGLVSWLDLVPITAANFDGITATITVGNKNVLDTGAVAAFDTTARPFGHKYIPLNAQPGQTWAVQLVQTLAGNAMSAQLCAFYQNPFDNPEWLSQLADPCLNLKQQDKTFQFAVGTTEREFPVESDQGQVFAIQVLSQERAIASLRDNRITVLVDGVAVIQNLVQAYTAANCTRKMLTLPIRIPQRATLTVRVTNSGVASTIVGVRLFYNNAKVN